MSVKNTHLFIQAFIFLLVSTQAAAQLVKQFQDGDRVCFIGDSITQGGSYHSYISLYYLTRFPDRQVEIQDKGIGGETAVHVLSRFDQDIASFRPTVSAVLLGMNDIVRSLYGRGRTDSISLEKQEQAMQVYEANMSDLIDRLIAIDSEVICLTPSIYDQTAKLECQNNFGANDGLGRCTDFIKSLGRGRELGVVDFYTTMLGINSHIQAIDPSATIVSQDRVHPEQDYGHFVMAYAFLKAQQVPKYVSKVALDFYKHELLEEINATVSGLKFSKSSIACTILEQALPFPQTDWIARGLSAVPFENEMNQQIFTVHGLLEGVYKMTIDGKYVGTWSEHELNSGVNLALIEHTPQFLQALEVKALNDRRSRYQGRLREIAYVFYRSGLARSNIDLEDETAVREYLDNKLKEIEGLPWHAYVKNQYVAYNDKVREMNSILSRLVDVQENLYVINQPRAHRYELTRQ